MRRGELLGLPWKNIDFKGGIIILEKTKNGERRAVPMNDTVRRTLTALPVHLHEGLVFPGSPGTCFPTPLRGPVSGQALRAAGIMIYVIPSPLT
jgi:integrase